MANNRWGHIRIETSETKANSSLTVYCIKELDDQYITTNYTKEEFSKLEYIESTLTGKFGDSEIITVGQANYEGPMAYANIKIDKNTIGTQNTAKNKYIRLVTNDNRNNLQPWKNGIFLVKFPSEIMDIQINDVAIYNQQGRPTDVKILGYDLYNENGSYFLKILTENENEDIYQIDIDCDITPDPRANTVTKTIELYALNELAETYPINYKGKDIYDIDENENIEQIIGHSNANISLISTKDLLTYQYASNYDNEESITIAPQVAGVDTEQRTADINIGVKNNYDVDVTDIVMQGVIPFVGNKYIIGDENLGSEFTTQMLNTGITVPENLKDIVTVYYSEEEKPSADITDENNKYLLAEDVTDWSKIKTYLISFGNYNMKKGEKYEFKYQVNIPEGIEINKIAYSTHGINYAELTEQGKYRTQTSVSKLGLMVTKKYDLKLEKYRENLEEKVPKITFFIKEKGKEEGKIKITDLSGDLTIPNLYAEKTYILKEIKSKEDYSLNEEEIEIYTYLDGEDNLKVAYKKEDGTYEELTNKYEWIKSVNVTKDGKYKVNIQLENEISPRLKIKKVESQTRKCFRICFV